MLKCGGTEVGGDSFDGRRNLFCCFLSRIGDSAFILAHFAFVDPDEFGKFADIEIIEIVKERRDVKLINNLDAFRYLDALLF